LDKIDHNVINRVKIILSHERNYFPDDKYQGLPVDGYTAMFKKMLDHPNITVQLKANAEKIMQLKNHKIYIKRKLFKGQVFYSGTVDQLFNYKMGRLTFRSLHFAFHTYFYQSFQPTANVNYPADPKMTRICEYKKMTFQKAKVTTISKEYPGAYKSNSKQFNVPYYPINNQTNNAVLQRYTENVKKYPQLHMIGRLGQYKYYDMDDAIEAAMCLFDQIQTN
jgi:UDP-galactopyranose mutase